MRPRSCTTLSGLPWEDDLPNLFGINPLEAAVLFGALYYFYGSETLYEYAREAGRLFSTYAPIVKDVSLDIFYEFRDYLEEDRERSALRKSGVDVDKMPRRTTNIIEKFQETMESFSGGGVKAEAEELQSAYGSGPLPPSSLLSSSSSSTEGEALTQSALVASTSSQINAELEAAGSGVLGRSRRGKTKREVLQERGVDVERIEAATEAVTRGDGFDAASLSESISAVKESLGALGERAAAGSASTGVSSLYGGTNSASNNNMIAGESETGPTMLAGSATPPVLSESPSALGMSKFQQQMSGEWNTRVKRRDNWAEIDAGSSSSKSNNFDFPEFPYENVAGGESNFDGMVPGAYDFDGDDLADSFVQRRERKAAPQQQEQGASTTNNSGTIPQDIESIPAPLLLKPKKEAQPALVVLQELDRDYLALRQRLVDLLQSQQQTQQLAVDSNLPSKTDQDLVLTTGPLSALTSTTTSFGAEVSKTKFWPPLARFRRD